MRRIYIRLGAIAGLMVAANFCMAGEWGLWEHVDGRPENFHKGETERMAVWHVHDGNKWHLVCTTAGGHHHFKGEIKLEGPGHFTDIAQYKGDGEGWKEKEDHDYFFKGLKREPEEHPKKIFFDLKAQGGESGLVFTTDKCGKNDEIKWELFFGGKKDDDPCESHPDRIFVGKGGEHPEHGRFKTWCHPDEHKGK
jgi:hypothetical protein